MMNVEEEVEKLKEEITRLGKVQTDGSYKVYLTKLLLLHLSIFFLLSLELYVYIYISWNFNLTISSPHIPHTCCI